PGPIIYRQTRLGEGGRHFTIFKLRTMRVDAEDEGSPRFAEEHDSRVTWIGHVLRQTHLDELPQLWNVLRGEMSVVGPRPERPEFVDLLERTVPFWTRRIWFHVQDLERKWLPISETAFLLWVLAGLVLVWLVVALVLVLL